jgi:hypothetical protein
VQYFQSASILLRGFEIGYGSAAELLQSGKE